MKKFIAILLFMITIGVVMNSCTASKGGCYATKTMIGYR
jgi:hypothetical protein